MRHFVRQSNKGGRVCAFNLFHKSKNCEGFLKILSQEIKFKGNVFDNIEAFIKYKNENLELIKEEYEYKFNYYRDIDEEEIEKYINRKLGELPIHKFLQQLSWNDFIWDFDAVSFYPSAMSDEKSVYPRIETGYAYTKDMNDEFVEKYNNQSFNQGSAILKIKYYNPKNSIVQHLPGKERVKKIEINRMRNGYNVDVLTSVDIQEIVKFGGKVIEI